MDYLMILNNYDASFSFPETSTVSKASESRNRTLGPIQLPKPQAAQTNACATFKNVCLWVQGAQEKQKAKSAEEFEEP